MRSSLRFSSSGAALAGVLLVAVTLLLVELPTPILDVLLVFNLIAALTLLLRGLFLDRPSGLYTFPTILVLATLFRLALNVSSTKLILLHGDSGLDAAGEVIRAFGNSVTGGDPVVGAIVFSIIAVVNFVVIAKGSGRVAEVSARFALDSLPGKQMSIDAEVRSGSITPSEGIARRAELGRESQFFGSMDGAMKWVQGDAMAGLAITFINLVGGVSLGVYRGLTFSDSLSTFGVLTIGDGLVSIIPSLLISVSAGIIVSRVQSDKKGGAGDEVLLQVFSDPRAAFLAASTSITLGLLGALGLATIPAIPFFLVGASIIAFLYIYRASFAETLSETGEVIGLGNAVANEKNSLLPLALESSSIENISLEVDRAILGNYLGLQSDEDSSSRLQSFYSLFDEMREEVLQVRGIPLPALSVSLSPRLARGEFRVSVRGQKVRGGVISLDKTMIPASSGVLAAMGIQVVHTSEHPMHGGSISWVLSKQGRLSSLEHLGLRMYNPADYMALECLASAFDVIDEVFGVEQVRSLLATIGQRAKTVHSGDSNTASDLVQDVFAEDKITLSECTEVLRRLVREGVSIRDISLILEAMLEFISLYPQSEDRQECLAELHIHVRQVLSRSIVNSCKGPGDRLRTFLLSAEIEEEFRSIMTIWDKNRSRPPLEPDFELALKMSAQQIFNPVIERGAVPIVVLCSADIRFAVQEFLLRNVGNSHLVRAVAFQELGSNVSSNAIGVVTITNF